MSGRRQIDPEELRKLWALDVPALDIAARFGVRYPAINSMARRLGLPSRRVVVRQAEPPPPPPAPAPRVAERADVRVLRLARVSSMSSNIQFEAISMPRAPWE